MVGGKVGMFESPSRDRLVYLSTCLIGHPVEVHLKNGCIYSGTCYTTNVEKEFGIFIIYFCCLSDGTLLLAL